MIARSFHLDERRAKLILAIALARRRRKVAILGRIVCEVIQMIAAELAHRPVRQMVARRTAGG